MVSQCLENNRTDPLTCICRWIHERTDLWWYVWGSVCCGTVDQKHNTTWFTRVFRVLIVMRSEKHTHLSCCSWLSSKNDTFSSIVDDTYENWCAPIKNRKTLREHRCFWFLVLYVELYFHTLWSICRTSSFSKHESLWSSLRNHVVSTHSDWTPVCPDPFKPPHSLFLLFLTPFLTTCKDLVVVYYESINREL